MDERPLTLSYGPLSIQLLDPIPRPLAETPLRKKMSRRTPVSALFPPKIKKKNGLVFKL